MRKAAVLLVSVAVIFILVGGLMTQSLLVLQRVAAVKEVKGEAWVKPRSQDEFIALAGRQRVQAGDTVKTGKDGEVELYWLDGTRIKMGADTLMTVLKCQINTATKSETSMFKLDVGRLWIRVLKVLSHKSKFEIKTPTATAGVRGTVFSVAVTPDGATSVTVREGQVAVVAEGTTGSIAANQIASTSEGLKPTALPEDWGLWVDHDGVAGPNLEITSPLETEKYRAGSVIEIRGEAELGGQVTVNGQSVPLGLKGRFKTMLTLPEAKEAIVKVVATDARGFVTRKELRLHLEQ
jgi:hypothetical protein